jgi:hypothetical protein
MCPSISISSQNTCDNYVSISRIKNRYELRVFGSGRRHPPPPRDVITEIERGSGGPGPRGNEAILYAKHTAHRANRRRHPPSRSCHPLSATTTALRVGTASRSMSFSSARERHRSSVQCDRSPIAFDCGRCVDRPSGQMRPAAIGFACGSSTFTRTTSFPDPYRSASGSSVPAICAQRAQSKRA